MLMFDNKMPPRIRVWSPGDMPGWYIRIEWTAEDAAVDADGNVPQGDDTLDLGRVFLEWKKNELGLSWLKLWFAPYP